MNPIPGFGQVTEKIQDDEDQYVITYQMTVSPAAESKPAFRYRLLLHEDDRKDGNAAPFYYRAQMDLDRTMERVREKYGEEYDTWYGQDVPLTEFPKEKVCEALASFDGSLMESLREATSRRYCNWGWQLQDLKGPETIAFLLPEMQKSRELARILALHTRFALAENRYDDAIRYIQMSYQLGQDVVNEPLLINGLVAIAITGITNAQVLELMAAPNAPNLYWAFAELPKPMVSLRPAVRFELGIGSRIFPILKDVESKNLSADQWAIEVGNACASLFGQVTDLVNGSGPRLELEGPYKNFSPQIIGRLQGCGLSLLFYSQAKQALVASGMSPEQVEAMPVGQVIAMQASRAYRHTAQAYEKLWYMPFDVALQRQKQMEEQLKKEGHLGPGLSSQEIIPIASMLLPAINACRQSQERLCRNMAAMQVIEALRMHAAITGTLPASLADVTVVPVPNNPTTNQPYPYTLDGETGILDLPASDGVTIHYRYEIKLR